jgi:hypothetical protein
MSRHGGIRSVAARPNDTVHRLCARVRSGPGAVGSPPRARTATARGDSRGSAPRRAGRGAGAWTRAVRGVLANLRRKLFNRTNRIMWPLIDHRLPEPFLGTVRDWLPSARKVLRCICLALAEMDVRPRGKHRMDRTEIERILLDPPAPPLTNAPNRSRQCLGDQSAQPHGESIARLSEYARQPPLGPGSACVCGPAQTVYNLARDHSTAAKLPGTGGMPCCPGKNTALLCRVGAGTVVGDMMGEYWLPGVCSAGRAARTALVEVDQRPRESAPAFAQARLRVQ